MLAVVDEVLRVLAAHDVAHALEDHVIIRYGPDPNHRLVARSHCEAPEGRGALEDGEELPVGVPRDPHGVLHVRGVVGHGLGPVDRLAEFDLAEGAHLLVLDREEVVAVPQYWGGLVPWVLYPEMYRPPGRLRIVPERMITPDGQHDDLVVAVVPVPVLREGLVDAQGVVDDNQAAPEAIAE